MSSSIILAQAAEAVNTAYQRLEKIQQIVTLKSCKGSIKERQLKVTRLMEIEDQEILDYLLVNHAIPFKHYMETGTIPEVEEEEPSNNSISFEEFWYRLGEIEDYKHSLRTQSGIIEWLWLEAFKIPGSKNEQEEK